MVSRLDPALWLGRAGMPALLDALGARDGAARPIGGFVRDALLGHPAKDLDLATVHPPAVTAERIAGAGFKVVPTGLSHGTVTAILPDAPVEVTTLRRDVATDGRHAEVAFTDDWAVDAARRDFTINALSVDPQTGTVFDYHGGLPDLAARRVRFIGEPLVRIAEDHLRILRFFRFQARFGTEPDAAALAACTARANDLMALSRERIASELLQLFALPDPSATVALMVAHGILLSVLPEIRGTGVERLRLLTARERALDVEPDAIRRFAALLPHDPEVADRVGARLRLSNAQRARLARLARPIVSASTARRLRASWPEADVRAAWLLSDSPDAVVAAELASLDGWQPPAFPIGGGDLIRMGLTPGPIVARTLEAIRAAWIEADFPSPDALAAAAVAQALRDKA